MPSGGSAYLLFINLFCLIITWSEGLIWLILNSICLWTAITMLRFPRKDSDRAQYATFLALLLFALVSRCLLVLPNSALETTLMGLEVAGVISFAVASATVWSLDCSAIASLACTCFCAVVRFSFTWLITSRNFSRWIYSRSNRNRQAILLRLSNRWKEVRLSYYYQRTTSDGPAKGASSGTGNDQSHANILLGEEFKSTKALQDGQVESSHFVRCTCYHDRAPLTRLAQNNDPEAGRNASCARYKKWIEDRARCLELCRSQPNWNRVGKVDEEQPGQLHTLCHLCEYFCFMLSRNFGEKLRRGHFAVYEHAGSPTELLRSFQSGCHLCTILWSLLNREEQDELLAADLRLDTELSGQMIVENKVQPQTHRPSPDDSRRCIRLAVCTRKGRKGIVPHYGYHRLPRRWPYDMKDPSSHRRSRMGEDMGFAPLNIETHRNVDVEPIQTISPLNTGDDSSIDLILKTFHLDVAETKSPWIPARLLEVSNVSTTGEVRLRTREDLESGLPHAYVALSHCWGTQNFLTYNPDTRTNFETGISTSALTKTFREAIEVTHRLGFHFIWIDSLCILQGVTDEWENEAHAMGKTYKLAALTLVAVASKDGSEGLFRDIDLLATKRCLLGPSPKNSKGLFVVPKTPWRRKEDQTEDTQRSKSNHRGWTLQEQILSPRLVYYGLHGLLLERKDVSARVPTRTNPHPFDPEYYSRFTLAFGLSWHDQWWIWVADYTNRQLTNPDDRGMAILGLADHVAGVSQLQYVDGLWKECILSGLLWYVHMGHAEREKKSYRGPTWSWLSAEGSVYNDSSGMSESKAGVTVVKISTAKREFSIDQSIETGRYLELHGKVRSCRWARSAAGDAHYYIAHWQLDEFLLRFQNEVDLEAMPTATKHEVGPQCYPMFLTEDDSDPVGWFLPDTSDLDCIPHELHCLCIHVEPTKIQEEDDFMRAYATRGLVLEPSHVQDSVCESSRESPNDPMPKFKRIGYFELQSEGMAVAMTRNNRYPASMSFTRTRMRTDPRGFFTDSEPRTLRLY